MTWSDRYPTLIAANEPKRAFAALKSVLRSTSQKWAATAATRRSISPKDLKEHYLALFKRRGEKVEIPYFADLKQDSYLTMVEPFKAKAGLKTGKSPGLNRLRSELLK
ncbi:unnamed protein product [Hymenolepis diminuta]|uniref:Uncharacterized protein n=1 Tax=Hymenolepis diminuta TaxID=6216 RepID=A0A564Z833_HYMDI|nr:unnamed protein product [Hymenolepis diminuta]